MKKSFGNNRIYRSVSKIVSSVVLAGLIFASVPVYADGTQTEWRHISLNEFKGAVIESDVQETTVYSVSSEECDEIGAINERLMELDYLESDEPSNAYLESTCEAVQMFERKNGFEMDGILTQYEYDLLMSDDAQRYSVGIGDSGVDVTELQERLVDLGFLDEVTGNFGIFTQTAVKEFQKSNEIESDGLVNSETREKIYSEDAIGKTLKYGDENEKIKIYQSKLKELGYYEGSVSGYFNASFRDAVKLFQSKNGLIADGMIGTNTANSILTSNKEYNGLVYEIGDNNEVVTKIQNKLKELGYFTSSATGYFGEKTANAVKKFQENNGLKADGKVNKKTLDLLLKGSPKKAIQTEEAKETKPAETKKTETKTSETKTTETKQDTDTKEKDTQTTEEPKAEEPKTEQPAEQPKQEETEKPAGNEATSKADSSKVEQFIEVAKSKLGCKYVLGAKGPEQFDCSGFVYWCLNQVGVKQGYMTSKGWKATTKYPIVSKMSDLQRGDIISYEGHVGIYLGNNQMIDASSAEGKVRITNIYSVSYWKKHFIKGVRVF